jgi:hypothetical protein
MGHRKRLLPAGGTDYGERPQSGGRFGNSALGHLCFGESLDKIKELMLYARFPGV